MARQWFRIQNAADDPSVVDIHIIDVIGGWDDDWIARNFGYDMGVTARAFVEDLAKLSDSVKTVRVHINSPGGDVQGGVNIANALREQAAHGRTVETVIDGIAASAASIIAMAGSVVRIADNALVMVHNPWTIGIGNAAEMRKTADVLDTIRNQIVATYRWHSTLSAEELVGLMDAETWMDADEAIANGFATAKVEGLKAAASLDPRGVAKLKVPDKFKARVEALLAKPTPAPEPASAEDVLRLCDEAGLETTFARSILSAKATLPDTRARITRARDITAACRQAKLDDRAGLYIASGLSVADVTKDLQDLQARLDKAEINGHIDPDHGKQSASAGWKKAFARVNHRFGAQA